MTRVSHQTLSGASNGNAGKENALFRIEACASLVQRTSELLDTAGSSRAAVIGGMALAPPTSMPIAKQLLEEIEAFAARNPGHEESVGALVKAVRRIDSEFEGEVRKQLLEQARETFRRQVKTLENAERTLEALEKLRENQAQLVVALKRLMVRRPEGATLH